MKVGKVYRDHDTNHAIARAARAIDEEALAACFRLDRNALRNDGASRRERALIEGRSLVPRVGHRRGLYVARYQQRDGSHIAKGEHVCTGADLHSTLSESLIRLIG